MHVWRVATTMCANTSLHTARDRACVGGKEGERKKETHHLTELNGRLAYLIPNPNRDLKDVKKRCRSSITHHHLI